MVAQKRLTILLLACLFTLAPACRGAKEQAGERAEQPAARQILMIGNSLTYVNDVNLLVQQIAQSAGEKVQVERSTLGGATLQEHVGNKETLAAIDRKPWDVVILQEHGLPPASVRLTREYTIPAARQLMARLAAKKCRVILLLPWARKTGVIETMLGESLSFKDYAGEQEAQRVGTELAAKALGVMLAPAGLAWKAMREKYPDVELYSDVMHGNINGSYLAALTIYATVYGRSPRGVAWHPAQIPDELAAKLVGVAAEACERYAAERKNAAAQAQTADLPTTATAPVK